MGCPNGFFSLSHHPIRGRVHKLKEFAQRFMDSHHCKPRTIEYYGEKLKRLLEYSPFADSRLDRIDEELIEQYVQHRRQQVSKRKKRQVSIASVNRELAVLRRALKLAAEWRIITRVPRIRMLPGEKPREFVLSHEQERIYLEAAPQPLCDIAMLILDTGLRIGGAVSLLKADVRLDPINGAKYGLLRIGEGKSKNAKRFLLLTERVQAMLKERIEANNSVWVFPDEKGDKPYRVSSLDHQHKRVRKALQLSGEAVIHSLRHTMLTRLGLSGVDVFTLRNIAGHSSVTTSEKYIHPSSESMERAFVKLEEYNEMVRRNLPATISATVADSAIPSLEESKQQVTSNQEVDEHAPVAQVDRATVS
jgi:integrase